ncbi:RING-H2 finger protein ATL56, partial [Bienertia sinuspersici]
QRQNAITGNNLSPPISGDFRQLNSPETPTKSNPKFLSLVLQALIMAFVISLFFIFIGVAAIIFLHLCIAGGALRHRRNRRRPNSGNPDSSSGYSLELLKSLPKSRFKGCETCPICLDNVMEGDICRVLPSCKHVFHLNCVDKWILKSPVCPVCRSSVKLLDHHENKGRGAFNWEHLWSSCG